MRGAEHYQGSVVTVGPEASAAEIADEMDQYAVGCVVVVDDAHGLLGIVTDRDLMRRVVVPGLDPDAARAADVMTSEVVAASTEEPLERVLAEMGEAGVRRLPVLKEGRVVGLVALDDVVCELGRELSDVRETVRGEVLGSRRAAGSRRRREDLEAALETLRGEVSALGQQASDWVHRELDAVRDRLGRHDG